MVYQWFEAGCPLFSGLLSFHHFPRSVGCRNGSGSCYCRSLGCSCSRCQPGPRLATFLPPSPVPCEILGHLHCRHSGVRTTFDWQSQTMPTWYQAPPPSLSLFETL